MGTGKPDAYSLNYSRNRSIHAYIIVFSLFFIRIHAWAGPCDAPHDVEDHWKLEPTHIEALARDPGTPHIVDESIRTLKDNDETTFAVSVHIHGLFDEPITRFADAVHRIDNHNLFLPRLETSDVICRRGTPTNYALVRQRLVFRLLIFSRSYEYDIHYFIEDQLDKDGGLRVWWVLADARQGRIVGIQGSWFFQRVRQNNRDYTYFAYALRTVMDQAGIGLRTAVKRFGVRDAKRIMLAMRDEAAR